MSKYGQSAAKFRKGKSPKTTCNGVGQQVIGCSKRWTPLLPVKDEDIVYSRIERWRNYNSTRSSVRYVKYKGSANFNNNKSKGANTLSGKIKELTEKNFSGVDINTFDIETCKGMQQVAELSEKARHAQIGFDENIAQEIKDIKVELVESLTKERDAAKETFRLLLDENNKMKRFLREKGLIDENNQVIYE